MLTLPITLFLNVNTTRYLLSQCRHYKLPSFSVLTVLVTLPFNVVKTGERPVATISNDGNLRQYEQDYRFLATEC